MELGYAMSEENQNPTGDRIEGTVGNDAGMVGVGKGNTQQSSRTGDIHINLGALLKQLSETPYSVTTGKRLMPDVEQEFRKTFSELTRSIVLLEGTVTINNTLTKEQISLLKEQVNSVKSLVESTEQKIVGTLSGINIVAPPPKPLIPTWFIYVGAFCLMFITIATIVGAFFLAQGGFG